MKTLIFLIVVSACDGLWNNNGNISKLLSRLKRDATGALDIITNHAQPIHADVKNENTGISKPCPNTYTGNLPSNIESGTVFQVVQPTVSVFQGKSLRKSLPLVTSLDVVRAVSRLVTLLALIFSAVVEFYPLVQNLYNTFYEFMYANKY